MRTKILPLLGLILIGFIIGTLAIGVIYVMPEKRYKEFCGTNSALMLSNWQTRSQLCVWFENTSNGYSEIYSRPYTCDIWNCSFEPDTTKLYQGNLTRKEDSPLSSHD